MSLTDLTDALKQYLQIESVDAKQTKYLESFCTTADGYLFSVYNISVLDRQKQMQVVVTATRRKFYLPVLPVSSLVVKVDGVVLGEDNYHNTNDYIIFGDSVYGDVVIEILTGTPIDAQDGILGHCVQLAAWLYTSSDKSLLGVSAMSSGVKESTKLFEDIPKNITYFLQSVKPIRF